jgi:hypothetical protein
MRLRTVLGGGALAVALVAAVVVLREHPAPSGVNVAEVSSTPVPPPTTDARARQLTGIFTHTTLLPSTVRFADDPSTPPGFVFQRFTDPEPGLSPARYSAEGSLVRSADGVVLDHVLVTVRQAEPGAGAAAFGACSTTAQFGGASCTEQTFPGGVHAKVVRNPVFAQVVADDATAGNPPGMQSELDAAFPDGSRLTITLYSMYQAGIPLDDAQMLRLATIKGL